MNRIYLSPRKKENYTYWIKDILDHKKLGKLLVNNHKTIIKLKPQFSSYHLKQEVLYTFEGSWRNFYTHFIKDYNQKYISDNYYDLPLFVTSCRLKSSGKDMFDRPTLLHPVAKKAWGKMKKTAKNDHINLQIISAYRSLDYQKQIIDNKIAKGISVEDILKVNVLPGYSEHHTGCAIDIGCKGESVLEEDFDQSEAFKWLTNNANKFGFYMTYPKDNTTAICYEPWHWCYHPL